MQEKMDSIQKTTSYFDSQKLFYQLYQLYQLCYVSSLELRELHELGT